MDILNNLKTTTYLQKEFWDSLQSEILISNQKLTGEDLLTFVEQNFMFSLFFRKTSQKELLIFRELFHIKEHAYLIVLEVMPYHGTSMVDYEINEFELYQFLKNRIPANVNAAIGPMVSNRINLLISAENLISVEKDPRVDSIVLAKDLINSVQKEYHLDAYAGIGNIHNINSIYSSFVEALSCMHICSPGQTIHFLDLAEHKQNNQFDYTEAEKYMLEAIRLKKVEAYDYFVIMMDYIRQLNDMAKRNKITEALILASHEKHLDVSIQTDNISYLRHINDLMVLKGDQLIEWAFQRFMEITGFVKPQSSIDYSNKIVQATKDYLEAHYAEEISLESVAEQVNISPQYFSKLIKKNTGFNFIDWLSMLRVKKAKELLTNSNYTVKEVCFMVGYKDPNYFSRIFKKRIGITPSEYIKNRS